MPARSAGRFPFGAAISIAPTDRTVLCNGPERGPLDLVPEEGLEPS